MRRLLHFSLLALSFSNGFAALTLARDLDVSANAPLQPIKPGLLDKAYGVGPRFRFASAPSDLSLPCATSISVNVNDANFVDYPGARTVEEFRSKAATGTPLSPSEAEKAPVHAPYILKGDGQISNAMCNNLVAGANARGFCAGTVSRQNYTIVYQFDPVACQYDNGAVGKSLETRLSVHHVNDQEPELDCATKLEQFVADIDDVLAKKPRNIIDVFDVLNRHFPLHGCTVDVVSDIVKTSKYFRSMGRFESKEYVFELNSEAPHVRGVSVMFGLTDTGDSELPWAGWSPPFL